MVIHLAAFKEAMGLGGAALSHVSQLLALQVANFHLRNGASIWRLNWMADPSRRGMEESFGIRVNYRYELPRLLANNRQYVVDSRIAAAPSVLRVLQQDPDRASMQWVVQPSADEDE